MRKILMFGTMLSVATTALAFGGVFNHGSKSTTYKGGVNAIGVHFGEKKQKQCGLGWTLNEESNECECPEERQCGDVCCGANNVCHPELNVCCHQDYEDWGDDFMDVCCAAGSVGYAGESCCEIGEVIAGEDDKHCCPGGSTGFGEYGWPIRCEEIPSLYQSGSCEVGCCLPGMVQVENKCCPEGSTYINDDDECCSEDAQTYYDGERDRCCVGTVSCVAKNTAGECIQEHCCTDGRVGARNKCHPDWGCGYDPVCCPAEQRTDLGNMYACCQPGDTAYCSETHDSTPNIGVCWMADCCPSNKVLTQIDHIQVCCEVGQEAYCGAYDDTGKCKYGQCH